MDDLPTDPPLPGDRPPTPPRLSPLIVTHAYFRGPLPPPSVLEAFERAHPGAAERIFAMAEDQIRTRHRLEEMALRGAIRSEARGQWLAGGVVLAGMGLGAWLAYTGNDSAGLLSMLAPLATVAAVFLHARNAQSRERELKRVELERARVGQPA